MRLTGSILSFPSDVGVSREYAVFIECVAGTDIKQAVGVDTSQRCNLADMVGSAILVFITVYWFVGRGHLLACDEERP